MHDILFTPLSIGSMKLKNRILMAPMATMAGPEGGLSAVTRDYLAARAAGGAALVFTGVQLVTDRFGKAGSGMLMNEAQQQALAATVQAVHAQGAKLGVELGYGNGRCGCADPQQPPFSASLVATLPQPTVLCREMSREDIRHLVEATGHAAALAQAAGVDTLLLHAYAGYLLDQFQSAQWNHRQDEYGGSPENRMRFTGELIAAIKAACGHDFPVFVKFSVEHHTPEGRQLPEGLALCRILEQQGADALIVDGGSFDYHWDRCIPTVYQPAGFSLPLAAAVKQTVSIPIVAQNKLDDPDLAAAALAAGNCDLVALGHAWLADDQWVNKLQQNQSAPPRPCIGCNECFRCIATGKVYACAVNPLLSHENDEAFALPQVPTGRRLLVIGGGPGGMEAALRGAEAGFEVELWEQKAELGGMARAAAVPAFKRDISRFLAWQEARLSESPVLVRLEQTVDAATLSAGSWDAIVLATGSKPLQLPIPGGEKAWPVNDWLLHDAPTGDVVIIGGGLVGCEAALHAVAQGAEQVDILEAQSQPLLTAKEPRNNDLAIRRLLSESPITVHCNARVMAIDADRIHWEENGISHSMPADAVVMAVGLVSNDNLKEALSAASVPWAVIGDGAQPRKIFDAVNEAYAAICRLAKEQASA